MNRVIVTGANGFIGFWLCKVLDANNIKTYAVLRDKNSYSKKLQGLKNVNLVFCDLDNIDSLQDFIHEKSIDVLYHLAWSGVSGKNRGDYHIQLDNAEKTLDLIMSAAKFKCRRFVGVGSIAELDAYKACETDGVAPDIVSFYGTAKLTAHFMSKSLCKNLGMEHTWACIGNTYGSDDKSENFINYAVNLIDSDKEAKFTSGEQYYDFVYVADVAQALYCIGNKGRDQCTYYIGSGKPRKLKSYIMELRDILNPTKELKMGEIAYNGVSLSIDAFDISKIKEDTDFECRITFEEGIKMIAESRKLR